MGAGGRERRHRDQTQRRAPNDAPQTDPAHAASIARRQAKRLTNASAVSATSRQPLSIVSE